MIAIIIIAAHNSASSENDIQTERQTQTHILEQTLLWWQRV